MGQLDDVAWAVTEWDLAVADRSDVQIAVERPDFAPGHGFSAHHLLDVGPRGRTPGDYLEVQNLRDVMPESVLITARKGTFGHGMSAGGHLVSLAATLGDGRIVTRSLSADRSGNVYLTGSVDNAGTRDFFTARISADGGIAWQKTFGGGSGSFGWTFGAPRVQRSAPHSQNRAEGFQDSCAMTAHKRCRN